MCVRSCSARRRAPHRSVNRSHTALSCGWAPTCAVALAKTMAIAAGGLLCRSGVRDGGIARPCAPFLPCSLLGATTPCGGEHKGCGVTISRDRVRPGRWRGPLSAPFPQRWQPSAPTASERADLRRTVHARASSLGQVHSFGHPLFASPRRSAFRPPSARRDRGALTVAPVQAHGDATCPPPERHAPCGSRGSISAMGLLPHVGWPERGSATGAITCLW